ncbi:MAG: 16S rRNA (cytosine(1402)-N(4))-methyltransferase RsmH [Bacteroidetes bacterium]|nr:16S rRNA (cytosine(1402)-N(4))-methyltransferase RsmH [Bacteroidota bacterium]
MLTYHKPVLFHESLEALAIRPDGVYVDVTFGGGGHSRGILAQLNENGRLLAFDQDADAEANVIDDARFTLVRQNFRYLKNFLRLHGISAIDGLLADLGVSSHQFDVAERGFSTRFDGPLDMRMSQAQPLTAADVLATTEEFQLRSIFRQYGEVDNAPQLARRIVQARSEEPIATIAQLKAAIAPCMKRGRENQYLAQVFQALRIEVNGELEALKALLTQTAEMLKPSGRMAVISYHSLEDRLVKHFFRTGNFDDDAEKDFYGNLIRPLEPVNRKPVTPGKEELEENPRSRSAKLRTAEKPQTAA